MVREIIKKPWGYENIWALTDDYVGKTIHIHAGHKLSRQYHEKKEETILVINGPLVLEVGSPDTPDSFKVITLEDGESHHVKPGDIHRFCATPTSSVTIVEVSTPYLKDVVRLEDDYNRK